MFLGEYTHTLDAKGRLTIPARMREALEHGLVVTRGHEPCITLFPLDLWQDISRKAAGLPITSAAARAFNRRFYSHAFELAPDRLGRILIPVPLRDYAGIEQEVVIAGANMYVEIWNSTRWGQRTEEEEPHVQEMTDELFRQGYVL